MPSKIQIASMLSPYNLESIASPDMSFCNKEFKIDTHWRAALEVEEMSVSWILSRGKKWQRSNEE